jgi:hypothetical protein
MIIPFNVLLTVLFGKRHLYYEQDVIGYWLECGSYIGLFVFLLFIIGCILKYKKNLPLLLTGVFFLFVVLEHPLNLWPLVRKFPFYSFQYAICRYIIFFILILSVFAGFGLDFIEDKLKKLFINKKRYVITIIEIVFCLVIVIDLSTVNRPVLKSVFINPPVRVKEYDRFIQRESNTSYLFERSSMYPVFLMNNGIINSYERISINKGKISTKPYDSSIPIRWAVFDFLCKGNKDAASFYIKGIENNRLIKENLRFNWKNIEPIQGLDGVTLSHRFSLSSIRDRPCIKLFPTRNGIIWHIYYVLFYIYSPKELENVSMKVGGASDISVWLNDINIFYETGEALRRGGNRLHFNLEAGWNKMLLRGIEIVGGFQDSMLGLTRIEKDREILENISYDVLQEYKPYQKINQEYKGEVYLENGRGVIDLTNFSPNKIKIKLLADNEERLIINQNFHKGWRANNNLKVEPYNGLISMKVNKGIYNIELYFLPNDFLIGMIISLFSTIYIIARLL